MQKVWCDTHIVCIACDTGVATACVGVWCCVMRSVAGPCSILCFVREWEPAAAPPLCGACSFAMMGMKAPDMAYIV